MYFRVYLCNCLNLLGISFRDPRTLTFRTCIPLLLWPHLSGTRDFRYVGCVMTCHDLSCSNNQKIFRKHQIIQIDSNVKQDQIAIPHSQGVLGFGCGKILKRNQEIYKNSQVLRYSHLKTIISNKIQQIHSNSLKKTGLALCQLQ